MSNTTFPASPAAVIPAKKVYYIDHVKVVLTVFVVLHHAAITYGAPGGWYYKQPATNIGAVIPLTLFVSVNQSYFMGLFFLLSAYFIEPSYERKGAVLFIADRLKRLGIPLLFYSFIFSPFITFLVYRYGGHHDVTFLQYLSGFNDWIDFGVLWFVAALLVFTMLFIMYKKINSKKYRHHTLPAPFNIFLFAVLLGLISFIVRLQFPIGWTLSPVGFQLAHFTQYIALFCIGILAKRNGWLEHLSLSHAKRFGLLALVMIFVVFPLMFILKERFNAPLENFFGGWHWESFVNSQWEQITGISIIVALLAIAKLKWDNYSLWLSKLSRAAFGVYIFHPLFLISLSLLLSGLPIHPVIKLLVVAPAAVTCSFWFASILVRIKGVNNII
jgi:surface polysaccharide O-acyltransferase-like enzyme